MTTREHIDTASPLEKFDILAEEIDRLRQAMHDLAHQRSIDELLEIVTLSDLAEQYRLPVPPLRKRVIEAGGEVFKIGKKSVIRKIKLLAVFEALEQKMPDSSYFPTASKN